MQICTLASSSSGNCTLVREGDTNILIDAGISMRRITCSIHELRLEPSMLTAVLVTHEHSDHICGLATMVKKYDVPIYAPKLVAKNMQGAVPALCGRVSPIPVGESFALGGLEVRAFHTPHDTQESVGYKITSGRSAFALATDMGHVSEEVLTELIGVKAAVLEANHDITMLNNGPYPNALKKRILSDRGHMSNRLCSRLAGRLFENGAEKLILGHLSRENNTPELAYETVRQELEACGGSLGENVELYVAPRAENGPVLEV